MNKKNLVIISGPTATGKTQLALKFSALLGGAPVINFDSLLFYKELNIGTAKPTLEERGKVPHYLIDITTIAQPLNAAAYVKLAQPLLHELKEKHPVLILVGGSGFYLRALINGMYDSEDPSDEVVKKSQDLYQEQGITPFIALLLKEDPATMDKLHPNDHYRIRRAVEHFWAHGTKFSLAKLALEKKRSEERPFADWRISHFYLDLPKPIHEKIIRKRTQDMFAAGLLEETHNLLQTGFTGKERPLRSIGYKEVIDYINQDCPDLEMCKERIVISTRQLAKAQRTWFKGIQDKTLYNPLEDQEKACKDVLDFIQG